MDQTSAEDQWVIAYSDPTTRGLLLPLRQLKFNKSPESGTSTPQQRWHEVWWPSRPRGVLNGDCRGHVRQYRRLV